MSQALSADIVSRYREDGVVCLRNVISLSEIEGLKVAIGKQVKTLGTSKTAYDFEAIARQIFEDDAALLEAGEADRFDLRAVSYTHLTLPTIYSV